MTAPEQTSERAPERAPARGGSPLRKKYQGVPLWLWVVGGTAVVTGVFVFVRNRRKGAADTGADTGDTSTDTGMTSPAYGNPISLVPFDNNGPNISSDQYNALITSLNNLNGTLSKPVTQPGGTADYYNSSVAAKLPGKFNQKWNMRELARALLPAADQSDKNKVELELRALRKYNPTWTNTTQPLGGHEFRKPVHTA